MLGSIYIASAEGHTGESTVALGLLHMLRRTGHDVGISRPVSRAGRAHEPDVVLDFLLTQVERLDDMLSRLSGLLDMAGSSDMRDVLASAKRGVPREARSGGVLLSSPGLRSRVVCRLKRLDAFVFTGRIGRSASDARALAHLGIQIDDAREQ